MSIKEYFIKMAVNKAQTDYQDHPESFLKGVTNHYSQDVDVYMYEAYAAERMNIIAELREGGE